MPTLPRPRTLLSVPICLLIAAGPALGLSACGGDDEDEKDKTRAKTEKTSPPAQAAPVGTETGAVTQPSAGDDEAQAEKALKEYMTALGEKNADAACDALSEDARRTIEQAAGGSCVNGLEQAFQLLSDSQVRSFTEAEVTEVQVTGDKAKATANVGGRRIPATLEKVDGVWFIGEAVGTE